MVQILLATYNGERYLQQQLDSLANQTYTDWKLLVRDDASTDYTLAIIEKFAAKHPGKVRVVHDFDDGKGNRNLGGAKYNFARLLQLSDPKDPYVMYCDQDDVWHPDKIAQSLEKMHEMEWQYGKGAPLLVHTDSALTDADNNVILPSHNRGRKVHKEKAALNNLLLVNAVWGMSAMMNRPLVEKSLPIPTDIDSHDGWVAKVAATLGHIGYVDKPLIDYRQHGSNVTDNRSRTQKAFAKLHRTGLGGYIQETVKFHYNAVDNSIEWGEELLRRHRDEMSPEKAALIEDLVHIPSQPPMAQRMTRIQRGLLPNSLIGRTKHIVLPGPKPAREKKELSEERGLSAPEEDRPSRGR